jgi:hypothetical protein
LATAGGPSRSLAGVDFSAVSVADSGTYFVYAYEATNPSASTWAIAGLELDVSASTGTPAALAATGPFVDVAATSNSSPHAEVGPISPSGWDAYLTHEAQLWWVPPQTPFSSEDSIAPGVTKAGFGLRSSYLPGVSAIRANPTPESCCSVPVAVEGTYYYHFTDEYPALGTTIAPRYFPAEVDLELLQTQLAAVCDEPLWIDDSALCSELADSLRVAEARLAIDDYEGAVVAVKGMGEVLGANRKPSGSIEDNAYWLLKINSDHVWVSVPGALPVAGAERLSRR